MSDSFIELHEYRKSLEEEFAALNLQPTDPPDIIRSKARTFAINHLGDALDAIVDLLNSDKDATKLSAAKAIVNIAFETSPSDDANPIETLFSKLLPSPDLTTSSDPPN